jgi:hypothetical protein
MKRTLEILQELERAGIMSRHAIGGAMGATFYVEPFLTFDLDVFVLLPRTAGGLLTLTPLYDALRARGYAEEGEHVTIEGVPVQFLPAYNALLEEALQEAREVPYEDVRARVLRAEHLAAICVQTGRPKDRERVRLLREQAALDEDYLAAVLTRHGLAVKWREWT